MGPWLVVAAWASAGWAVSPDGPAEVRQIRFRGMHAPLSDRSNATLRQGMAHPLPRGLPLRRRVALDRELLQRDRRRVLTHFAHRGFFDADLTWEIEERRPARGERPAVVTVVGRISPGPPSLVHAASIDGLEQLPPPTQAVLRRAVTEEIGERFAIDTHEDNLAQLTRRLQLRGYPSPHATGEVQVDREGRRVSLTYAMDPGPRATYGEVEVTGLRRVPAPPTRRQLAIDSGAPFDVRDLEKTRAKLYAMEVFSLVALRPMATDDPKVVDVEVRVEERDPRGASAGVGLGLQSGRQEALVTGQIEHLNALGRLLRVDLGAQAGVALLGAGLADVSRFSEVRGGPVVDAGLQVRIPEVPGRSWETSARLGFEHTLTEAYRTNRPSLRASVRTSPTPKLTLSWGYRLELTQYVDLQIDPAELLTVAPDLENGRYFDTALQQQIVWDTRNEPLAPSRGHLADLSLELAGPWLGGDYAYARTRLDLRGYRRLGRRARSALGHLVVAGRLGGGIALPYGPEERAVVPVAQRLFLGGTGSVRGWTFQHLGPYVCDADDDPCQSAIGQAVDRDVDTVPIGGRVATWGSLELRRTWRDYRLVLFSDVGMVWRDLTEVSALLPQPSVGLGGRVLTPVGPVRLDLAVRATNPPMLRHEPRLWVHLGLGEAF